VLWKELNKETNFSVKNWIRSSINRSIIKIIKIIWIIWQVDMAKQLVVVCNNSNSSRIWDHIGIRLLQWWIICRRLLVYTTIVLLCQEYFSRKLHLQMVLQCITTWWWPSKKTKPICWNSSFCKEETIPILQHNKIESIGATTLVY
jgi:hypothetical protein